MSAFARLRNVTIQVQRWKDLIFFCLLIAAGINVVRLLGWMQTSELMLLDRMLKMRWPEQSSEHVVLVGINEEDLNAYGGFPLSDQVLTEALQVIESANPYAIGLDLFRDISPDPNRVQLGRYFANSQKLIGAKVVLNADDNLNIPAAPELPPERTGFVDVISDPDHKLRRMILASRTWSGELEYSLAMRLAIAALRAKSLPFHHGDRSTDPIQLGSRLLTRVTEPFGGYQKIDANGNQILLNFSTGNTPFQILSLRDVLAPGFDPSLIRNKVVLVGMTAASVKDIFYSDAVPHTVLTQRFGNDPAFHGRLYGVEFHAHTVHQLLETAVSGRPSLWALPRWIDTTAVFLCGFLGVGLGLWLRSPWQSLVALALVTSLLGGMSFLVLLEMGLWMPLLPLTIVILSTGISTAFFDREVRRLLEERKAAIVQTYESVHNGPLQTLALLIRGVEISQWSEQELSDKLKSLNQELRGLYDQMQESALELDDSLYLQNNECLSLQPPLDQLLQVVYAQTLQRPFPGFETLRIQLTPDFKGLEGQTFSIQEKRGLCLFLEEALNNIGKHGIGTVCIDVSCVVKDQQVQLTVINRLPNEIGIQPDAIAGQGTQQAQKLAQSLGGKFRRRVEGKQFICELVWPIQRSPYKMWLTRIPYPKLSASSSDR